MTLSITKRFVAPLAAVVMLAAPLAQQAAAAGAGLRAAAPQASHVTTVQWRRGGGGFRWFGPGRGLAILGGVIVGGALVATAIAERRASESDIRRCARDFPDFDPRSGTWVDRHGDVKVCPYLY